MGKYVKSIDVKSGHHMHVESVTADELLEIVERETKHRLEHFKPENYTHFYVVRNFDLRGVVFFYMAKGFHDEARGINGSKVAAEHHVWYRRSGGMWSSLAYNLKDAIEGAQRDGWLMA